VSIAEWDIPVLPPRQAIDREEAARALRLFWEPGERYAIQALRSGWWGISGFADGSEAAVESALNDAARFVGEAGTYITLNPLNADFTRPEKGAWKVGDIARRVWMMVDVDPTRASDTNSTDAEKAAAHEIAIGVIADLDALGFPEPIMGDSPNGHHLYYRVDLPNDKPSQKLLAALLKGLASRHDTPLATIDTQVASARLSTKLYGTWARKGPHSAERPHRVARLIHVPDRIEVVPLELLQRAADRAGAKPSPEHPGGNGDGDGGAFRVVAPDGWSTRVANPGGGTAYAKAALEAEAAKVAGTTSGRNSQLYESALKIGGYVASGLIDESEAKAALLAAASEAGLGQDGDPMEAHRAIDNGLSVGKQTPKTAPEQPSGEKKKRSKLIVADPITGLREPVDDERRLARLYLKTRRKHPDRPTLADWNGEWHGWRAGAWTPIADREIDAELTAAAKAEFERHAAAAGAEVLPFSTSLLGNVRNSLRSLVNLPAHRAPHQPAWLDTDGPDPAECVNFRNGILHLPTLLSEGPEAALSPPTPLYFTANALDFDFDPNPPEPKAWLSFLESVWPDDPESILALQQWFGYLLTPDTSQQKILLLLGPKRAGKGTIIRTIADLVGANNIASPRLTELAEPKGTECLIGKSVALCGESRITGRADSQAIVEIFLSVSGEDPQTIPRKYKSAWIGHLTTRFVLASNELPRLGDYSEAILSRLFILKFTESFEGREDRQLQKKLKDELPGILLWALAGWESLRAAGGFTQPASGMEEMDEFKDLNNPIGAFLADRCEVHPEEWVAKSQLYAAWVEWCKEHGKDRPGDVQGLCRNIKTTLAALSVKVHDDRHRIDGRPVRGLRGLRLIDAKPF